jgi:hypothetical protein
MATVLVEDVGCWARRDDAPPFEATKRGENAEVWACNALPVDQLGLCAHHRARLVLR